MITGTVVGLRMLVGVPLRLPNQPDIIIECVVDTGFEGALALPPDAVAVLGLPFYQEIYANLADNSDVSVDAHRATIVWKGHELDVAVLAMGRRPLLGTALLAGKELVAQFVDNGPVTVDDI
jgi:clan AA aspartic protease